MSKQSEAKERQAYIPKLVPTVCGNCKHFESVLTEEPGAYGGAIWVKETGVRCGLGGFKVMKMGSCKEHTPTTGGET